MNLVLTVLEIVAPVFLLAAIGFCLGQDRTRVPRPVRHPACDDAFGALSDLYRTDADRYRPADLVGGFVGQPSVAYGLGDAGRFPAGKEPRASILRTYLAPLIFGNTGNLGLPLALFAYGDEGLGYAVVIFAIMGVYSFTFGVWLVSGGGSPLKVIKEPLVGATLLGALFLWQGWETPMFLTNTLSLSARWRFR